MAKRKPAADKSPTADRHQGGVMVRLPEAYRAPLAALKAKTLRTTTTDLRVAINAYLKANGIDPPEWAG